MKADFAVELQQSERRDRTYRSTSIGPHRDDLQLLFNDRAAAQFGSEGQKAHAGDRAQARPGGVSDWLARLPPVLLIDDIMGELDVKRRSGLVPLLQQIHQSRGQVFMTATEENWPEELSREVQRWWVKAGTLQRNP